MSDLINGREMLNRYQVDLCYGIACKDCSMCTEDGDCRVEKWIDTFPSADRPQGEWIDTGKDPDHSHPLTAIWYRCSECGDGTNTKTNYCPNCGAQMKGADDE